MSRAYRSIASNLCPFQAISTLATHQASPGDLDPFLGAPTPGDNAASGNNWQHDSLHLYNLLQTGATS